MAKIQVTAGKDRLVPIPSSIQGGPGGMRLILMNDTQPSPQNTGPFSYITSLEVDEGNAFAQRALRNGDFIRKSAATSPDSSAKKE